jgi:hypothetical protein
MQNVFINVYDYRADPTQRTWDLPSWGHPLSQLALPLFVQAEGRYLPIGTAFWIGPKVQFIVTAMHNIHEAIRFERRFERLLAAGELPASVSLKRAGLGVLHQDEVTGTNARFSLIPVRTINGGPPGDVAFGHPEFGSGRPVLSLPLSFDPPRIGERVWSLGYTDFEPRDGIPVDAAWDGSFDWARDYRHRFVVTEGRVERIFTQRFDRGYCRAPCFSFDNAISHGQSGGPVISERGLTVGINSCVPDRFDRPTSLGSMLYPLLLTGIEFGATMGGGNFTLNMKAPRLLVDLVTAGVISSDGSEKHVHIHRSEDGEGIAVGPRIPVEDCDFVHEDFQGFQDQRPALPITGEIYRLKQTSEPSSRPPDTADGGATPDRPSGGAG